MNVGGLPPATTSWRENFKRLAGDIAASPLPTRQLRRMAGRSLAKAMAAEARLPERRAKVLARKVARAKRAAGTHWDDDAP